MTALESAYEGMIGHLMPPGPAWSPDDLLGLAAGAARLQRRMEELLDEADPRTCQELLVRWERVLALPDPCLFGVDQSLLERRQAVVSKVGAIGGQDAGYFIAVAAEMGFDVTISTFRPFRVGVSGAGSGLSNGEWQFAWRINAPMVGIEEFSVEDSSVEDSLRSFGNALLECRMEQIQPAEGVLIIGYGLREAEATFSAADRLWFVANYKLPT